MEKNLEHKLIKLELYLLKPEIRSSESELSYLLSDNFLEFTSTGDSFGKAEALARIPGETSPEFTSNSFEVRELEENVVQLIYRATIKFPAKETIHYSLRSSIWKKNNCGWQMEFHQGTPCAPF
ncbi:MAG: DUF4440 domain-containing protein [Proteobacteria bacterium]|nr:DUF4440 domain-containing protein [Pseudomonadota bacterium]